MKNYHFTPFGIVHPDPSRHIWITPNVGVTEIFDNAFKQDIEKDILNDSAEKEIVQTDTLRTKVFAAALDVFNKRKDDQDWLKHMSIAFSTGYHDTSMQMMLAVYNKLTYGDIQQLKHFLISDALYVPKESYRDFIDSFFGPTPAPTHHHEVVWTDPRPHCHSFNSLLISYE